MQRSPDLATAFERHERKRQRDLKKDRPKLFRALGEFIAIRGDIEAWLHFRKRWPDFFPDYEYEKVARGEIPSIADYPDRLDQIWRGGETQPYLGIMLGIDATPGAESLSPEEAVAARLSSIQPLLFQLDWHEGSIVYWGGCDFQRALYLVYRESWRAKICPACETTFIASRATQRYCTTDCSESMQREVKKQWWRDNGQEWRKGREASTSKTKGGQNGTGKAR